MSNTRSTGELAKLCHDESERYRRGAAVQRGDCYELFRRAIVDKDQEAWSALDEQYRRLVAKWVNGPSDQVDDRINEAFVKFWRGVKPESFVHEFAGIGKVLAFLRVCARSVKLDIIRKEKKVALISTEKIEIAIDDSTAPNVLDKIEQDEIRKHIQSRLKDDQERLVFYLSFEIGLKPRQIAKKYPKQFENAKQVSRIKERIVLRLRNDPQLQAWSATRS